MLEYVVTLEEFCFAETYCTIDVFENLIFFNIKLCSLVILL
jgi:hypothetical protein